MIISTKYSGNINKVKNYIEKLNIDHTSYIIIIEDGTWTLNVFGKALGRKIEASAPRWLFWCRDFANSRIIYHEYLHLQGIVKCEGSWYKRIFCIMYENDKNFLKEVLIMPFQLLNFFRLCKHCQEKLK
jgi:hypothetical protein